MNIVIVGNTSGIFRKKNNDLISGLNDMGYDCTFIFREPGDERNIMADIRAASADLLITEDLEGFEMCTLTDAVSYNLIHCRQLHFLFSDKLSNEKYLAKQLSLVMTFVCRDAGLTETLKDRYPDLPEVVSLGDDYSEDEPIDRVMSVVQNL